MSRQKIFLWLSNITEINFKTKEKELFRNTWKPYVTKRGSYSLKPSFPSCHSTRTPNSIISNNSCQAAGTEAHRHIGGKGPRCSCDLKMRNFGHSRQNLFASERWVTLKHTGMAGLYTKTIPTLGHMGTPLRKL